MSEYQEAQNTYVFPDRVKGTTLPVQSFEVTINGVAPAHSLSTVVCVFAKDGIVTLTPTVAITDSSNWQFTVGPVAASGMDLAEGLHVGDIETTADDGTVSKYCRVEINILPSPQ